MLMIVDIIGHFGGKQNFQDGQTVKTKSVYGALKKISSVKVRKTDTFYIKRNPFIFLWQFLRALICGKKIIVLLSSRGRKFIFPILCFCCKYLRKQVYHYTIGGRFANDAIKNKKILKF